MTTATGPSVLCLGGLGPDERLGIVVPGVDPFADVGFESLHAAVAAALEQVGENQRCAEPCVCYGDSAYGTGDLRGAIDDADHDAVIKPNPLQAAVEGGFTVDDFTVDEAAATVTCPAGYTRPISRTRVATFGALCRDCPLRQRCTKAKAGRQIVLHERDALLRQARHDWATDPELRENYRHHRPQRGARGLTDRHPRQPPAQAPLPPHREEPRLA
jgi:Transposase DDE domain